MPPYASTRFVPLFVATASLFALAGAATAQYGFDLRPCILCLAQRIPFALAALVGLVGLSRGLGERTRHLLAVSAGVLFALNAGLALYHVGVERHWWVLASCSGDFGVGATVDLVARLNRPVSAPCDQPPWAFHGLTLAGLNALYSSGLALMTWALARRR